jgi:hypothetical protein
MIIHWTDEEWQAMARHFISRIWVEEDGALTVEGLFPMQLLKAEIESPPSRSRGATGRGR